MRVSSKPVSSPGRPDNYPPVLMRFLRTNIGSKSRGRCRSSPMFLRRKNPAAAPAVVETLEPSSPKVTCMGQVRIRRSKKPDPRSHRNRKPRTEKRRRLDWFRNALFCPPLTGKLKAKSFRPDWRKWASFSRFSLRRKSEKTPNSAKSEPICRRSIRNDEQGSEKEEEQEEEEDDEHNRETANRFASLSSTPPKNAFLLTRCRSAPYKSSSLANRFWGSPVSIEDESKDETEQEQNREDEDNNTSTSKTESNPEESNLETKSEEETEKIEGLTKEIKEKMIMEQFCTPPRRLILTRSKSEPDRTGRRLDPDIDFWKQRRLGFT